MMHGRAGPYSSLAKEVYDATTLSQRHQFWGRLWVAWLDRANAKDHIAFGRGSHACPGGPLARAEGRISVERILDRMHDIRLSEEHHGPAPAHRFEYEPTWILRGLRELHIEFTPGDH